MRQFRKGDIVTIECVVESHFTDTEMRVRPVGDHTDIYARVDQVKIVRDHIEAGDMVRNVYKNIDHAEKVLSVVDDHVWVKIASGGFETWFIGHCRRVDCSDQSEAA